MAPIRDSLSPTSPNSRTKDSEATQTDKGENIEKKHVPQQQEPMISPPNVNPMPMYQNMYLPQPQSGHQGMVTPQFQMFPYPYGYPGMQPSMFGVTDGPQSQSYPYDKNFGVTPSPVGLSSQTNNEQPKMGTPFVDHNAEDVRSTYLLSTSKDIDVLSERQCYVRSHFIELFIVNAKDVQRRNKNGAQKVLIGQVGLRCAFCVNHQRRAERAICYPSKISRIYQTVADMQRRHFEKCVAIPATMLAKYKASQVSRSRGEMSPQTFWEHSAREIGLMDSELLVIQAVSRHASEGGDIRGAGSDDEVGRLIRQKKSLVTRNENQDHQQEEMTTMHRDFDPSSVYKKKAEGAIDHCNPPSPNNNKSSSNGNNNQNTLLPEPCHVPENQQQIEQWNSEAAAASAAKAFLPSKHRLPKQKRKSIDTPSTQQKKPKSLQPCHIPTPSMGGSGPLPHPSMMQQFVQVMIPYDYGHPGMQPMSMPPHGMMPPHGTVDLMAPTPAQLYIPPEVTNNNKDNNNSSNNNKDNNNYKNKMNALPEPCHVPKKQQNEQRNSEVAAAFLPEHQPPPHSGFIPGYPTEHHFHQPQFAQPQFHGPRGETTESMTCGTDTENGEESSSRVKQRAEV